MRAFMSDGGRADRAMVELYPGAARRVCDHEARRIMAEVELTLRPTDRMWRTATDRDTAPLALADALRAFVDEPTCAHRPSRLYFWVADDGVRCVGCCDCGEMLAGAS